MNVSSALDLVNALIYWPGWRISATDHTNRFEGAIKVRIDYPARNSNRDQAPEYREEIVTYVEFPVVVDPCDDLELYRCIVQQIQKINLHETREGLRVQPTMWAPFHPHRQGGMQAWGDVEGDLKFGVC